MSATSTVDVRPVSLGARIDLGLFRRQRELLAKIADLARRNLPYVPESGDEDLLEGLLNLTDAVADAAESVRTVSGLKVRD